MTNVLVEEKGGRVLLDQGWSPPPTSLSASCWILLQIILESTTAYIVLSGKTSDDIDPIARLFFCPEWTHRNGSSFLAPQLTLYVKVRHESASISSTCFFFIAKFPMSYVVCFCGHAQTPPLVTMNPQNASMKKMYIKP